MRDASGTSVLRRYFAQGESLVSGTGSSNYFYTRDHLGSVREAVGANGQLATRYNYDPYGQKFVLQEGIQTTFGFTGDFVHQKSGLNLTWFRALDSTIGRWLSRDPAGERVSMNLYSYALSSPITKIDRLGLDEEICEGGAPQTDSPCEGLDPADCQNIQNQQNEVSAVETDTMDLLGLLDPEFGFFWGTYQLGQATVTDDTDGVLLGLLGFTPFGTATTVFVDVTSTYRVFNPNQHGEADDQELQQLKWAY
jgi:RHS repeat-associated protein